jgi:signal transduction histidine kinase
MTLRKTFALVSLLLGLLLSMLPAWAAEEGGAGASASFRVGLRGLAPPYVMYGENGTLTGMSVEMYEEVGRRIGRPVQFRLVSDWNRFDELLMQGEFDVAPIPSSRVVDPALIKFPAYRSIFYQLYVHKDYDTVFSVSDLDGLVVGYSSYDTRDFILRHSKPRQAIEFISVVEGMLAVDRKLIHAYLVVDRNAGEFVVRNLGLRNVVAVGPALEEVPLSIVGRKADAALVESVSRASREMMEDGTMNSIGGHWIRLEGRNKYWERYGRWGLLGAVAVVLGTLGVVFWNQQLHRMVKSVTADLQLSEQRYRVLLESAPFMALLVSSDGDIHFANAVAVQELGLPAADHPGNLFDHVLDTDRPSLQGILHDASAVRTPSVNLTFLRPGQDAVEVEIVAVERPVANDSVLTCCFLRNVTQEKTMQRALQEQDRLAIVGAMAAGFAHEINNPLAIIQANVDNLQTLDLPEEERQGLMAISRSLERMGALSQRLLLLSKTGEMKITGINLNDVVEDCLQLMRHRLRGVDVRTDLARGGAWMRGDAHLVSHVLLNLLLNAHEAMSSASVRAPVILVRTCSTPDGTSLCVADNGPGIPRENLLRIFDLFFTSGKPTGVGLGLYLCQRIVRSHGGLIFAQSSPGTGTMLSLEFSGTPPLES